ncbi:hypothetical protein [Variovorax boronicumulans]|nr:hypothetical protein [Variovorax boronicumulans]
MKKWLFAGLLAACSVAAMGREIKAGVQCTYPPSTTAMHRVS